MGRVATYIAAKAVNADNLAPLQQLPEVAFTDALLPKWATSSSSAKKPLMPVSDMSKCMSYSEVKKNRKGKLTLVNHKQGVCGCHIVALPQAPDSAPQQDQDVRGNDGKIKTANGKNVETASDDAMPDLPGTKDSNGKVTADGEAGEADKKPDAAEFTPEEDAKLKTMKAENKTWREIAQEMKRPQSTLKNRFKAIKDDGNTGGDTGAAAGAAKLDSSKAKAPAGAESKKQKKDERKPGDRRQEKAEKSRAQKQHTKPKTKTPSGSGSSTGSSTKFSMGEWQTLQEDDLFSFEELRLLARLIMKDSDATWLRIASRFADRTGRRVHQDDIREKFEQMANMKA